MGLVLTSCSDDDDDNESTSLNGLWWDDYHKSISELKNDYDYQWLADRGFFTSQRSVAGAWCFNFINNNTVQEYNLWGYFYYNGNDYVRTDQAHGHTVYCVKEDLVKTHTYVKNENKIILSDGKIFTLLEGKLYLDGSTTVLTKTQEKY